MKRQQIGRGWAVAAGLLLWPPTAHAADLSVSLDGPTVVVRGATVDSEVAVVGAGREQNGFATLVRGAADSLQSDREGTATLEAPWQETSAVSWVAADVASGTVAWAFSDVGTVSETTVSAEDVAIGGRRLQLVVVRRGSGAWVASLADGGAGDLDGVQNGRVTLSAGELRAASGEPPPPALAGSDRVAAIDQDTLRLTVLTLRSTHGETE